VELSVKYKIKFDKKSKKDLLELEKNYQTLVLSKIELLSENLQGDVKKLTNFTPEYRLRVGNYRVLFEVENDLIIIYKIKHRKESYK